MMWFDTAQFDPLHCMSLQGQLHIRHCWHMSSKETDILLGWESNIICANLTFRCKLKPKAYTPYPCMGCEDSHLLELHPLCGIVICQSDTKVCLKSIVFSKLTVTVRRMAEHEQSHSHYVGCAKLAPIGT